MAKKGLNKAAVVECAAGLADAEGVAAVSMARLAKTLGIALPSLYAHVRSLENLRHEISLAVNAELSRRMGEAIQGRAGREAVDALAQAYRAYAVPHAGRYAAATLVTPDYADPRAVEVARSCASTVYDALRGYGLGNPALTHAARFVRANLHGFVSIEGQGGFGADLDIDASFDALLAAVDRALTHWAGDPHDP